MSLQSRMISILRDHLDSAASVIGMMLGATILLMNLKYSNEYLVTIGPMLIIVCAYFLLYGRKHVNLPVSDNSAKFFKAAGIVFWLSLAFSILVLKTGTDHRPVLYFVLTAGAAAMIALQILNLTEKKSDEYLVLFEIAVVALNIAVSAFWAFPSLVGFDPFAHFTYIKDFVDLGHIESTRGFTTYLSYPITHLSVTVLKIITTLGYKESMFLAIGLPLVLSTMFVYLIGRSLSGAKVGLLATLLVNLSDVHLQFGVQLMPTSFGIMLFTIIFYLIVHEKRLRDARYGALAVGLMLLLVITHTMSSFVMAIFILCLVVGSYAYDALYRRQALAQVGLVTTGLLMFFLLAMFGYWIYGGIGQNIGFFDSIMRGLTNSLEESAGFLDRPAAATASVGYWGPILHIIGFIIIYLFGTLGILAWLSQHHLSKVRFAMIAAVVLMTAFALAFPLFGMRNIVPYRWYAFIYVPLSIISAFGIFAMVQSFSNTTLRNTVLVATVVILSFFMITNKFSNIDSPVYAPQLTQRLVYSQSEIDAGTRVASLYDGLIVTDSSYSTAILKDYLDIDQPVSFGMTDDAITGKGLTIYRKAIANTVANRTVSGSSLESQLELSYNLVYDNSSTEAFLPVGR